MLRAFHRRRTVLAEWANPSPKDRLTYLWRPLPQRGADPAVTALTPVIAGLIKDGPGGVPSTTAGVVARGYALGLLTPETWPPRPGPGV